jgi:uncharacterized DUF497 family protein
MISWDTQKSISNFDKHNVSFEEAASVFIDDNGLDWEDLEHSQSENRMPMVAARPPSRM